MTVGDRCLGHVEGTASKDGRLSDSAAIITGLDDDAGTGVTATECGLGSGHFVPQRLQSEGARKGLCGAVVNEDQAEAAVATQPGVVAGPPDDRKRAR